MAGEEKGIATSELNIFFDEHGAIGMGGGIHIKLVLPGTPTVETIKALIERVHEAGDGVVEEEKPRPRAQRSAQPKPDTSDRCPEKGVYVTQKGGKYKVGFYADWRHDKKELVQWKDGTWHCPTVVDVDEEGNPVWCEWAPDE